VADADPFVRNKMTTPLSIRRRDFIGATAAGALLLTSPQILTADPNEPTEGETEHFYYRLAPADPYMDSHRDNKAIG